MNQKNNKINIVGISDVTLGFGSSQILAFMDYMASHYDANITVFEPDQTDMPKTHHQNDRIKIHRITTSSFIYDKSGRIEYIAKASKIINKLKPDILVIFVTFCIPILFRIDHRPKFVVYYALESVSAYGELDIEMNKQLGSKVDLIIFPEENRASKFVQDCQINSIPICTVYNCTNYVTTMDMITSPTQRNGKIIHQGRLKDETAVDFYLDKRLENIPIDLYGTIDGKNKDHILQSLVQLSNDISYKGILSNKEIARIRKQYAYSITYWRPTNENTIFACPNKFFESIADGIPPITAPIPQCKMLIQRYKCGIIIDDWSFDSFHTALKSAIELYNTQEYKDMVNNCIKAVTMELNWAKQLQKIEKFLNF